MKKILTTVLVILMLIISFKAIYYNTGLFDTIIGDVVVENNIRVNKKYIEIKKDNKWSQYEIRGVNIGNSIPGKWPSDNGVSKKTYLRWFKEIKELGANTIRIYTVYGPDFYDAFYEYNLNNDDPLYLIQGVWVNDYKQNSHMDAHDSKYKNNIIYDCKATVRVIHGDAFTNTGYNKHWNKFDKDVSEWVIGYIVGSEWRESTVVYTNNVKKNMKPYKGVYVTASDDVTPFENMLVEVQDKLVSYESKKYKEQRIISFSNWSITDPFKYPKFAAENRKKPASIDANHIIYTDKYKAGGFVSYHLNECNEDYLKTLNEYHKDPVIIAEYGVSTGRGVSVKDAWSNNAHGHLDEEMQGNTIIEMYKNIINSGCSGSLINTWQDEWYKKSENTVYAIDENKTIWWNDVQSDDQFYGLLSFDPGIKESVCYVDGNINEWNGKDIISGNKDLNLSAKFDERFLYFKISKKDFDPDNDKFYIPIDTIKTIGSTYCENFDIKFDMAADFLIVIDGKENSKIMVQERYNSLDAMYSHEIYRKDAYVTPPSKSSPLFKDIRMMLGRQMEPKKNIFNELEYAETYDTGLLEYGNGNPKSREFNSLADFYFGKDNIEIRIPWQLLNFYDPSEMKIHDDYYEHYGVEPIGITSIYAGIGNEDELERIQSGEIKLTGWKNNIKYHERLKKSYYMLQEYWGIMDRN